ncbi:hypothetical protein PC117_g8454 [Phytophthora cactorum]|uniref:Uncharacterized protein n=1 Tax=Phytophthora cactorum TaxID=29920 RepID=A0A8T1DXW5_9STRA|nr:hypothetical protein PC117_g8454 [Phytophthora cactorum]
MGRLGYAEMGSDKYMKICMDQVEAASTAEIARLIDAVDANNRRQSDATQCVVRTPWADIAPFALANAASQIRDSCTMPVSEWLTAFARANARVVSALTGHNRGELHTALDDIAAGALAKVEVCNRMGFLPRKWVRMPVLVRQYPTQK